jgi:hypothetical protein
MMSSADADQYAEILIVAAGVVLTLLIGGALWYWIDREWRELDARHRRHRERAIPPRAPDDLNEPSPPTPPES